MRADSVTAVIPTIPPRRDMLARAVSSVSLQTHPVAAISIAVDATHEGAPATRDRALQAAATPWVAFLDDDDVWGPEHLEVLLAAAEDSGADYVYSYYTVMGMDDHLLPNVDPLGHFGRPFDVERPHQTTITTLVRTDLAQKIGFREPPHGALIDGQTFGEDFLFTVECAQAGAKILHVPQRTWLWTHHSANTSGRPDAW